jgi:hypothetical protein
MLHPSDDAFAFDERRQLGEVTSHVPNVMGTRPTEP